MGVEPARLSQALWSTRALFFINGASMGGWSVFVPIVRDNLGLSVGMLGVSLFFMTAGALATMPLTGAMTSRWSSASVLRVVSLLFSLSLVLPVLAPELWMLVAAFFVFGALNGAMDVAMNAEALAVEEGLARPIMSGAHGAFSVGGLAGAASCGLLLTQLSPPAAAAAIVTVTFTVSVLATRRLLPTRPRAATPTSLRFAMPERAVLILGLLAFLALMGEGAVLDWSAALLHEEYLASTAFAAAGYAVFSAAMAIGRLSGDWLSARVDRRLLFRASAAIGGAGLLLGLMVDDTAAVLAGFACLGLGLSNLVPILFSAAARGAAADAGPAVSVVATLGYTGFLVGPPLIGFVAQSTDLKVGMAMVAALALAIAFGGSLIPAAAKR